MRFIPLTQGRVAVVDDVDYPLISQYNWYYQKGKGKRTGYARTGGRCNKFMHRLILPKKKGYQTDHIDGCGLNNMRSNLRYTTQVQNMANGGKKITAASCYRGVHRSPSISKPWVVTFFKEKRRYNGGYFTDEIKAAIAADELAKILYGDFARLNFPCSVPENPERSKCGLPLYKRKKSSKYPGVGRHRGKRRWRSEVSVAGRVVWRKYFDNECDAFLEYLRVKKQYV